MTPVRPCCSICLVEDDPLMGESLSDRFVLEGYKVRWHRRAATATEDLALHGADLLISDIRLPDQDGATLFQTLKTRLAHMPPTVFITGYGTIDAAVSLMQQGAADYVTKPFVLDEFLGRIRNLLPTPQTQADGLGVSAAMRTLEPLVVRVAAYDSSVLISGESGVGKEVLARRLHSDSPTRREGPFIAVNCAALPESLIEAELFGHEKGAYTGAGNATRGVFERAHGGVLFLDEISELPLSLQGKLLRVTQDHRITRLGGETTVQVDVRLIAASNRDLAAEVKAGRFREDLYYRLAVVPLWVPPLRQRRDDIPWLTQHFLADHARRYAGTPPTLTSAAMARLMAWDWPGNVRELKNCVERACIMVGSDVLDADDLLPDVPSPNREGRLSTQLEDSEREAIRATLEAHDWRIARSASALGISRKTLWEKMRKLGLKRERTQPQ